MFSIPVGTRSIGYLTKLLKPENKLEESFATWEKKKETRKKGRQKDVEPNVTRAAEVHEVEPLFDLLDDGVGVLGLLPLLMTCFDG